MKKNKDTNHYSSQNQEFIILNAGISKYRPLRVHLLPSFGNDQQYIFDIIINKNPIETAKTRKTEKVR